MEIPYLNVCKNKSGNFVGLSIIKEQKYCDYKHMKQKINEQ